MGRVPVNNVSAGNRGLAEMNHHIRGEHKEVRNGVVGEGQGLLEEDELKINGASVYVNAGCEGAGQAQPALQRPQQQSQGPVVRWERFLPFRPLKILLVENDDSTRHVVCALLQNCGYEVTAASNGLQAWKILENLTNNIDLVLTEVVMPCLSGIGLLCKIMNHKTCKNIPVIIKPIRKNELQNLWQHVWRRFHSPSGSGSESGIQIKKSTKSRSAEESDNNTSSNDEDDNASIGLNARDGSDNGSGTQSSWTKRAVEVDSPPPMSPWDHVADPPDITCAQVIHPKPEEHDNEWFHVTAMESQKEDKQLDSVAMGKDLEIGVSGNPELQLKCPHEKVSTNLTSPKEGTSSEDCKNDSRQLELNGEKQVGKLKVHAPDLIGGMTSHSDSQMETGVSEAPNVLSKTTEIKDKTISDAKGLPSLELTLKRLGGVGDIGTTFHGDRNMRHSDLSAFSKYNTASTAKQTATANVGSCSVPLGNSSDAVKTNSVHNIQSQSNTTPPNQWSNGSRNNNDMGSTTKNVFTRPTVFTEKLASTSAAKYIHPSAFQPVQNSCIYPAHQDIHNSADNAAGNIDIEQAKGSFNQIQVQHHHHHYHHHHHHVHNVQQKQPLADHDDLSLKNMAATTPQCESSNVFGGPAEGNVGNYSLNRSASRSNHGSNRQNGSSTPVKTDGMNVESDNGIVGRKGTADGSGSATGSGVDQNRFAQRAAALTKFRQKRKERCFEKKVRYQSRKRLAEQRPRVRGQFVRQAAHEKTNRNVGC